MLDPLCRAALRSGARFGGVEFSEILALFAAERPSAAALLGLLLAQFEALKTGIDVRPPCAEIHGTAHRLAVFAVVDDVDAGIGLAADNIADRCP